MCGFKHLKNLPKPGIAFVLLINRAIYSDIFNGLKIRICGFLVANFKKLSLKVFVLRRKILINSKVYRAPKNFHCD